MNHQRGPRVWQVAVWRGRLRRLIAAGWQALITLRWRLLRRWRMIDPRCQGPRDAAHSWRTTARAPRRRHRCTRLVDLANVPCFCTHFCRRTLHRNRTKLDRVNPWQFFFLSHARRQRAAASTRSIEWMNTFRALSRQNFIHLVHCRGDVKIARCHRFQFNFFSYNYIISCTIFNVPFTFLFTLPSKIRVIRRRKKHLAIREKIDFIFIFDESRDGIFDTFRRQRLTTGPGRSAE